MKMLLLLQNKGQFMRNTTNWTEKGLKNFKDGLIEVAASFKNEAVEFQHPWYISSHLAFAFEAFARSLESNLLEFQAIEIPHDKGYVALMLRSDTPLEGFDLLLQVLLTGHKCQINIPGSQVNLLNLFLAIVKKHLPEQFALVSSINKPFANVKGLVYKGQAMNETMRSYLNFKNLLVLETVQRSVLITGSESIDSLHLLARDITLHFGRAADSVIHLRVPRAYDFNLLLNVLEAYQTNRFHSRYLNHYEYQKAALLINKVIHFDTGYLLFCSDSAYKGKISVVTYQHYNPSVISSQKYSSDFGYSGTRFFSQYTVLRDWLTVV